MKKLTVILAVVLALGVAFLAYTNPSEEDFVAYVRQSADASTSSNMFEQVASRVISEAAGLDAKLNVRREDYFMFSVFTYKGPLSNHDPIKILGMVHRYCDLNEE